MANVNNLKIILDGPQNVYLPGNVINGRVHLELTEEMTVQDLCVTFIGEGCCSFKSSDTKRREREQYVNSTVSLLGRGTDQQGGTTIKPGANSRPFQFQVPNESPTSYEGTMGHVRYSIWAVLDKQSGLREKCFVILTVLNELDLNHEPDSRDLLHAENSATASCLFFKKGPASIELSLERKGYVPGESIPLRAVIHNSGSKPITVVYGELVQITTYHSGKQTTSNYQVVSHIVHDNPIRSGEREILHREFIPIPPLPPSYLRNCNIIDIKYKVKVRANSTGLGSDVSASVDVIIGTVPLTGVVKERHPSGVPPASIYGLYEYGKCITIQEPNSIDEDSIHEADFTPSYTYYDFSQHQGFQNK